VVKAGLKHNAAAAVLAHNHPSGGRTQHADRQITERLKQALELVDIRLLDHGGWRDGYRLVCRTWLALRKIT
jgi:DNA repair protein RadC